MSTADVAARGSDASSLVRGATTPPLLETTIGDRFDEIVRRHPDRPALVSRAQGRRWNYRELGVAVDDFARGLASLGLRKGDRIGIWSPNNAEWVITQFATAKLGLILVTINPAYRTHEVEYALRKVGCSALITATSFKSSDYVGMLRKLAPEIATGTPGRLKLEKLPDLHTVIRIGGFPEPGLIAFDEVSKIGAGAPAPSVDLDPDDAINIQFTSGTTGSPKGATLTHRNILNNAHLFGLALGFTPADKLCIPVPFYHCFGMVMSSLMCVTQGATMVISGESFDPLTVLETVQAERCTALHGVPTMFIAVLQHQDFTRYDLSSLRTGAMAGAPCPVEVMRRVIDEMGMSEITIAYGMTETSPISFQSDRADPIERRVSTVGTIHPHLEVKIVDVNGHVVPRGVPGELCTRGYSVMKGYWEDPSKTAEVLDPEGWMHTGDIGTIDNEGYCNITGRIKDMVIRGGENIFPREIEEFLYRHPHVQDVQVFGVPDPKFGEELCAWIRLKDGQASDEDAIRAFCRDAIAHYKIPRYIRFVDSFPMTVSGKAQKFVMREAMVQELSLAEIRTA
ncbi:AMP-binding protein [Bradyrhizobium sp. CIAT3101]|uniref:AMP-binding protein n=1 Tax=Bradyrhizobium sp. CIAT3101 TaxID=439387 RepID=UPI0024B273C9|nr:AMP-binding protein [Bradyrhizobium sp. CIAT3101]WFU82479.1 AMP-binding protein [Bradyrhizobium sp. CIAT3101]